ncbi:MAG: hypothetical protein GON13_01700 [Nanoarchaeota archaeon]|nr:hypothetical protein [Nanoarchaeota archaeon]
MRGKIAGLFLVFLITSVFGITKTYNELLVITEFPEIVVDNEFSFPVNITNLINKTRFLEVYSYVYEGSNCVSGSWTSNLQILEFAPYELKELNLTNFLEPVNGLYAVKLRIRENTKDLDLKSYLTINQTLKKPNSITGYSMIAKTVAYAGLSLAGLVALYVVMKKL